MKIEFQCKYSISVLLARAALFSAFAKVSFAYRESQGQALRVRPIKFAYRTNFMNHNLDFRSGKLMAGRYAGNKTQV